MARHPANGQSAMTAAQRNKAARDRRNRRLAEAEAELAEYRRLYGPLPAPEEKTEET